MQSKGTSDPPKELSKKNYPMAANQQLNVANEAATQGPKIYSDIAEADKFDDVPTPKARALMQAIILKAGSLTLHQVSVGGHTVGWE